MRKKIQKIALITGITGQDGSYLAEFLLKKKYKVHGLQRRISNINSKRIDHIYQDPQIKNRNFEMHYGDLTDSAGLNYLISQIKPDEIYNLAAQSHVKISFEVPEYTAQVNAIGTLKLLEAIKTLKLEKKTKFYQASTSELFGEVLEIPQNEKTPFNPSSPYGVAKLYAYYICKNYRDSYGIFACNGILFNHESKRRGETFVTRKITIGVSKIAFGKQACLYVGNLDSKRDWGHAKDYVRMQWLMLQQKIPEDYVIATGVQYSIRDFINLAFKHLDIKLKWFGESLNEKAIIINTNKNYPDLKKGQIVIKVNKRYFRPKDVNTLLGDASKARKKLKWQPKISFENMIKEMMDNDLKEYKN